MNHATLPHHPLEKWLTNRRRAFEEWRQTPPYGLGLAVLLLVAFEFVLAYRLAHGLRLDASVAGSAATTAVFIMAIEAGVLLISNSVSSMFGKKGHVLPAFVGFNVALMPMFLFLPFALYSWAAGGGAVARVVVLLIIVFKILSDWKEIVRSTYKLSGIQTYLLGGVLGGVGYMLFIIFLILSGFGVIVQSLFSAASLS
jgi:hypothetical protein